MCDGRRCNQEQTPGRQTVRLTKELSREKVIWRTFEIFCLQLGCLPPALLTTIAANRVEITQHRASHLTSRLEYGFGPSRCSSEARGAVRNCCRGSSAAASVTRCRSSVERLSDARCCCCCFFFVILKRLHGRLEIGVEFLGRIDEVEQCVGIIGLKKHAGDLAGKSWRAGKDEIVEALAERLRLMMWADAIQHSTEISS